MPHPTCPWKRGFGLFGYGLTSIATTRNKRQLAAKDNSQNLRKPGLTKDAYHTIFIYEKNAYHTLSYHFIELKCMHENSKVSIFFINEIEL